jgi:UDP-2,3-diacylglucosamine pyrophosphatase LpxH
MIAPSRSRYVRSIFVSDVHLGSKHAQAEAFLSFLNDYDSDYVYLVGDFIDGWRLRRVWHWAPVYNQIIGRLLEVSRRGGRVFYTPGNHDAFLRDFASDWQPIAIADEFVHETADGRRFLVTHGDLFDTVEICARWLSVVGAVAYNALLSLNRMANLLRSPRPSRAYAFSSRVKQSVKRVVRHVSHFEERLQERARAVNCDGIICGHIHTPALRKRDGITYCNTGDWVENCTALVEHPNGTLELLEPLLDKGTFLAAPEPRRAVVRSAPAGCSNVAAW